MSKITLNLILGMKQTITPTENDNKKEVKAVMDRINNRLKKYLDFKIPNQVLLGIISPIAFTG